VREGEGEGDGEEDVPEDCGRRLRSLAVCVRSGEGRKEGGDEPIIKPGWVMVKKLLLFVSEAMISFFCFEGSGAVVLLARFI
jgi:hypothetical protein